jgi:hypothetical protein
VPGVVPETRLVFDQKHPHGAIFAFGIEEPNRRYAGS